jgi:hypothetical protein
MGQSRGLLDVLGEVSREMFPNAKELVQVSVEEQFNRLEAYDLFDKPNPFKEGDYVTPIENFLYHGAGDPHKVLRVYSPVVQFFADGSPALVSDMLVAWCRGENIRVYQVHSSGFQLWRTADFLREARDYTLDSERPGQWSLN